MKSVILHLVVQVCLVASWDYTNPDSWADEFPTCGGDRQSPIDIVTDDLTPRRLLPLTHAFCPRHDPGTIVVKNTAKRSFKFDFPDIGDCNTFNVRQKTYKLAQMHFHWGSAATMGTEHSINGITYPAELHAVHYDTTYASLGAAVASGEGDALAVVGYMFSESSETEVTNGFHGFFDILSKFDNMPADSNMTLDYPLSLDIFLPSEVPCYAHYEGSLTTPGCFEIVQWFVASEIYEIPQSFLSYLRRERDVENQVILQNWRPVQPLGNRSVYTPMGCKAVPLVQAASTRTPVQQAVDEPTTVAVELERERSSDRGLFVAILVFSLIILLFSVYAFMNRVKDDGVPNLHGAQSEGPTFVHQR